MSEPRAVLIVFAMPGCPACHDYLPRFQRQVEGFKAYGAPFVYHEAGKQPERGQIPILVIDSASEDQSVVGLADQYNVQALPTTILLTHNARPVVMEGSLEDQRVYELLVSAVLANR